MATVLNRDAYLDKGERVFVGAVAFVLAAETLCTIVGSGTQFAWPRLILGVFGGVFILYLAQRLYAGDAAVEKLALGWAGFQIVLMAASITVGPAERSGALRYIQEVGVPWRGLALIKLLAYAAFAACLLMRCSARAFLVARRGEEVTHYLPAEVVDDTTPVTLATDQAKVFGDLASWMTAAGAVLAAVGVLMILSAIPPSLNMSRWRALGVLEGLLTFGLGAFLIAPALAFNKNASLSTMGRLQSALQRLTLWHFAAAVAGLLLLLVVVWRFLIEWRQY